MKMSHGVFGSLVTSTNALRKQPVIWILWLFLLFLPSVVQAQFGYATNNNNTITITGYTGSGGAVTIPDMINGLPVVSIADFAFQYKETITSIAIPYGVTYIGTVAFEYCTQLMSIRIPETVTNIENYCFNSCYSLTNIAIPARVKSIRRGTFSSCTNLMNVTIPNSLTIIEDWAFGACTSLPNVTIPNSVTQLGNWAFSGCTSLTSITIPSSVVDIGHFVFRDCTNLSAIIVDPNNPAYSSGAGILFNKERTVLIEWPRAVVGSYVVPATVTSIGYGAFAGSGLTSVTFPFGVDSIGEFAFLSCGSLTNVTILDAIKHIADYAFLGCGALQGIYIEGNAPSLGAFAVPPTMVFYLPGTTGWGPTFGLSSTAPLMLANPVILSSPPSFGIQNNRFGFTISWATNASVVVESSTNLSNPWVSVASNVLVNGTSYFSDPRWTNYAARFYRVRSL